MGTHSPQTWRFFLMTVDPVHVGTGGARLGRVDNPVAREAGTHLPKIPGTALHGAIRHYVAHRFGKPQCAGQGKSHCGQPTCPICYTFGYARDKGGGRAGVVAISDAHILFFPVYSMVGPVWVTSPAALEAAGSRKHNVLPDKARWGGGNSELPTDKPINLGWLMVEHEGDLSDLDLPADIPEQIRRRIVLVSDKLFSQIVNSNLEVRTSVSINPETGAAEEGALFTYEAIPRATILWMDVVVNDYRGVFPSREHMEKFFKVDGKDFASDDQPGREDLHKAGWDEKNADQQKDLMHYQNHNLSWAKPLEVLQAGLEWAEHLGVGGMGTRGFGRIRNLACCLIESDGALDCACRGKRN